MNKTLYLLIGPKGSGKTYIGSLVAKHTDIVFLRVEKIWLSLSSDEDGWLKVAAAIEDAFESCNKLMIENLGAGEAFQRFHAALDSKYDVKRIRVRCNLDTCLKRVQHRENRDHIPVSDAKVVEYNRIASRASLDWDLEIDNNGPALDADILGTIADL